jgi:uncharacterized protein DUF2225
MSVPVQSLSRDQKVWYARFVIGAILADDEISPSEVNFMKQVISIVDSPSDKKELMQLISSKKPPPLAPPKDISKEVLAAIFVELILIMISDLDFADKEKVYLKEVSDLFCFSQHYLAGLMKWGEEGLNWKVSQRFLVTEDGKIDSFHVPLDKLNSEQKKWYAYVLISTIMLDGLVDETELPFLKAAMTLLDSKKDQQQLVGYVRNKMAPPIKKPKGIPEPILLLIFFEIILTVSADESLSYKEKTHLKTIADLCGFSSELFEKSIQWCNQGIEWKKNKNPLIARCEFDKKASRAQSHGPLQAHPENNSILIRNVHCFVCDSPTEFKGFQLKPHSQEPNRNIFGITTYLESLGDHDYIDYNMLRIFVCPTCLFASTEKNLFKKVKNESAPADLNSPKFKKFWLKEAKQRQSSIKKYLEEYDGINRTVPGTIKSYDFAAKAAGALAKTSQDQSYLWQVVTLKLTEAEIVMSNGEALKADEYLEQARAVADELFQNAASNLVAIRSARVLFFIALYHNDLRTAGPFVDYIRNLHLDEPAHLKRNELTVLKKIYGETQNAVKNRSDYKKEKLIGYHLEV